MTLVYINMSAAFSAFRSFVSEGVSTAIKFIDEGVQDGVQDEEGVGGGAHDGWPTDDGDAYAEGIGEEVAGDGSALTLHDLQPDDREGCAADAHADDAVSAMARGLTTWKKQAHDAAAQLARYKRTMKAEKERIVELQAQLQGEVNERDETIRALQERQQSLVMEKATTEDAVRKLKVENGNLVTALRDVEEKLLAERNQHEHQTQQSQLLLKQAQAQLEDLEQSMHNMQQASAEIKEENERLTNELRHISMQTDTSDTADALVEAKKVILDQKGELTTLYEQIVQLQRESKARIDHLESELSRVRDESSAASAALAAASASVSSRESEYAARVCELESELSRVRDESSAASAALAAASASVSSRESEYAARVC
ncbi:hypothetical protein EON66_09065, partial [archaeon]